MSFFRDMFNQSGQQVGTQVNVGKDKEPQLYVVSIWEGKLHVAPALYSKNQSYVDDLEVVKSVLVDGNAVVVPGHLLADIRAYWAATQAEEPSEEVVDPIAGLVAAFEVRGHQQDLLLSAIEDELRTTNVLLGKLVDKMNLLLDIVQSEGESNGLPHTDAEIQWLTEEEPCHRILNPAGDIDWGGLRQRNMAIHSRMNADEMLEALLPVFWDNGFVFATRTAVTEAVNVLRTMAGSPLVEEYVRQRTEEDAAARAVARDALEEQMRGLYGDEWSDRI